MAEIEDGDPFKKYGGSAITNTEEDKDPFAAYGGKTLKKKVKSDTGGQSSVIGSTNPLNPARENVPGSFNFAESVNPEMYNEVQEANKIAKENQSARLSQIEQAYSGNKKAIQAAKQSPLKNEQLIQGVQDSDRKGNRAVYIYNELLNGVGSIAAGLGDVALQAAEYSPNTALSSLSNTELLNQYRGNAAPTIRNFLTEKIGGDLDKGLKSKYQNETFTAALGGLAQSAPAIAATVASGGIGTGAIFLQSYDNALSSIDQTEDGRNLDNATKTYFATGVGIVTAALEKFGLDRIFKGETGIIGGLIAKQALKKATAQTGGRVTGDIFTKFLDKEVINLSNKYIKGGIRALDGALVEYGTESLQEATQAGAELLLNEKTGKPVFDTSNSDDWIKFTSRMHKAGVMGAIGGGLLGGVAGIANLNKNKLINTQTSLDEINAALNNENISESSQRVLIDSKIKLEEEIDDASNKIDDAFDRLDDTQKERVIDITDRKVEINEALNDPAIPDSVKETLNTENETLDKELESINPETKPVEDSNVINEQEVSELENNVLEAEEMIIQMEQMAELETDPVEKAELLENIENAKDVIEKSQSELNSMNKGQGSSTKLNVTRTRQGYEGDFMDDLEFIAEGSEHSVYRTKDGKNVIKIGEPYNDPSTFDARVNDALLINELVGDGSLRLIGYYESANGTKNPIYEQSYIDGNPVSEKEVGEHLINKGFTKTEKGYAIEIDGKTYEVSDLSDNFFKDKNGNIIGIDASVIEINKKDISKEKATEVKKPVFTIKGENVTKKEETKDATKIGKQQQGSITEREGATEQQQRKQEDRNNEKEPITKGQAETSRSNSAEQGGTKQEVSESFNELAHRDISSDEFKDTLSNKERESGKELTQEEKEYRVTKILDSLNHGNEVVEQAKKEFGDDYASKLLNYVKDNAKTLPIDKQSLMLISLENSLERQLLAEPDNLTLQKQAKMITNELLKRQRSVAKATGLGRLRQIAREGYDVAAITDKFFSPTESEARGKIVKAVESTSEDVQKEYESEIKDEAMTPDLEKAIAEGVDKKINELYEKLPTSRKEKADKAIAALDKIQKRLRSKTYDASIGLPVAIIDAGITTIKAAIRAGVSIADAIELGINKIKEEQHGKEWKKENDFRSDMLDEFRRENINTESVAGLKSNTVKEALIAAGYGREITVTTKDGKQKREILDWKKLTGEEGSLGNINNVIDTVLGKKGYSAIEISNIKEALKDEYNSLHASIIEKAENELATRNKERTPAERKSSAKRLAELYNYGLFEKESDTYDKLINSAVGLSQLSNKAFMEAKQLAKSLAKLYNQRDENGNLKPEITFKKAVSSINNEIEALLTTVTAKEAPLSYKIADNVGEYVSVLQRDALVSGGQAIENSLSGYVERLFMDLGYAVTGNKGTKALRAKTKQLARVQFTDIILNGADDFGDVTTPFISKSRLMDKLNNLTDNQLANFAISVGTGRVFLEGADSMHKIALTEKFFVHNLIKILRKKGMSKKDATDYVSDKLTGQSFNDAIRQSKQLIDDVNADAGKKVLPDNESNIVLLANDIVRNSLLVGNKITLKEMEASQKAAYKAAGYGLGHEANNPLSEMITSTNTKVQFDLKKAIKEKNWGVAVNLRLKSILMNNVMNPYVGGGTNWMFLTMEKAGVNPLAWVRALNGTREIDLTSDAGVKNLSDDLLASLVRRNSAIRTVVGMSIGLSVYGAYLAAKGDDDDKLPLSSWLKENKWANKYFEKIAPTSALLIVAAENDDMKKFLEDGLGVRDNKAFSNAEKVKELIAYSYSPSEEQKIKSLGALGDLIGSKNGTPILPWRLVRDIENVYRGLNGLEPKTVDYTTNGFWNGFFKAGLVDYLGFRPEARQVKPLTPQEINKLISDMQKQLEKQRNKK